MLWLRGTLSLGARNVLHKKETAILSDRHSVRHARIPLCASASQLLFLELFDPDDDGSDVIKTAPPIRIRNQRIDDAARR